MKKVLCLFFILTFFSVTQNASASGYDLSAWSTPGPYTIGQYTYDSVIYYGNAYNHNALYFNAADAHIRIACGGFYNYTTSNGGYPPYYPTHGLSCDANWNNCTAYYNKYGSSIGNWNSGLSLLHSNFSFGGHFTPDIPLPAWQLMITIDPLAGGNVTGNNIACNVNTSALCQYRITKNSSVILTANPNAGWEFDHWDDGVACYYNPELTVMMNADKNVTAVFTPVVSNVNVYPDTTKGSVVSGEADPLIHCDDGGNSNCSAGYSGGNMVSLIAKHKAGYAFVRWEEGGIAISTNSTLNFTMGGSRSLTPVFEPTSFRDFRNTVVEGFIKQINDIGGECVDYVKTETSIKDAQGNLFTGDAWTYYAKAIEAGYKTGDTPIPGAIVVFDKDTLPNVGHVGIVVSSYNDSNGHMHLIIRDSNWCDPPTCHTISQHDMDINGYTVHYIYYVP
ncbi:MAG: CHAP domain-containing protein [Parcubacteria group bacterium]|jgi:hypothetical protein